LTPPRKISGIDTASRKASAFSRRKASSNGYALKNFLPMGVLSPRRTAAGMFAANSLSGTSPRNRYIGLSKELPALSSRASR
jgi:hypothetical protein